VAGCVSGHDDHHDHGSGHQRHILWIAFFLNFPLFVLELWQGIDSGSTSLIADSMDFLSDSASYLITLHVLARPLSVRAKASIFKAFIMMLIAVGALGQGIHNILHNHVPEHSTMGWVAALALLVNIICAYLLFKTRGQDSNMRSIWLCSRNDAFGNICVLAAAALVYATGTLWPDLAVAIIITWLNASAAVTIYRQAKRELTQA